MKITQVEYIADPEFFSDEICEYPPCNESGYGVVKGMILCAKHYLHGLKMIKYEKERLQH